MGKYDDVIGIDFDPSKAKGSYEFLVELNNSVPKPKGSTEVTKTPNGWIFPEDVMFMTHDEYMYAFGAIHKWRTADMESWELIA